MRNQQLSNKETPEQGAGTVDSFRLSASVLILFITLALFLPDLMKMVPFFHRAVSLQFFSYIQEIADPLTVGIVLLAAWKYGIRLAVTADVVFISTRVSYAIFDFPSDAPGLLGILISVMVATLGILVINQLHNSESRFRNLFENAPIGIALSTLDGAIIDVNKAFLKMYGYDSIEELKSRPLLDGYTSPQDRERWLTLLRQQKKIEGLELQLKRKDGTLFWGSYDTLPQERKSGKTQIINVVRDITEQKKMHDDVLESRAGLAEAQRLSHLGSWELEIVSGKLTWSDEVYRMFGMEPQQFRATYASFLDNIHPDDRDVVNRAYKESLDTGKPYDIVHRLLPKDGTIKYVNEKCQTFYRNDIPVRSIGTVQDITERWVSEARNNHLTSVLRALRGINLLITHQHDKQRLIQESCELMVNVRGFLCAWIVLFDENFKFIASGISGGEGVERFREQIANGIYPACIYRMVDRKDTLAMCSEIGDGDTECLPKQLNGRGNALISRLVYGGKLYGMISTYMQSNYAADEEEQSLFRELASDISFALHNIEQNEEREREEAEIGKLAMFPSENPNPVIRITNDGLVTYANRASLPVVEHWGLRIGDYCSESVRQRINQADRENRVVDTEIEYAGKTFSCKFTPISNSGYVNIYGMDITARKLAEGRLNHIAEEWRTTFDSATDAISIHDKDSNLIRANKAFSDILGRPVEELIGEKCYWAFHSADKPVSNCPHVETCCTNKPAKLELFEPHLNRYFEVTTSPIFDEQGQIRASVHIARDITERRKMDEQLMLTDRMASIGQLASGIAHELNNPLTAVIGFSELLLERDIPDDVKEDLVMINKEARRTASVVKGLLTFARRQRVEKEPVDINRIIQEVLQLRSYEENVNNIRVVTAFAPDLPQIAANAPRMQQVFINLIVNAEQAMIDAHGRGTMTVTTELLGDKIRACVADNGPGVSPENMRRLFNPFFTTKEVGKGTGLGLSICHGIITEHGGRIWAESIFGKGANFIMELPLSPS
jgi:PAS domain S-box-containing protein